MTLTEGEYIMTMLGFFCFVTVGLIFLAWIYEWL